MQKRRLNSEDEDEDVTTNEKLLRMCLDFQEMSVSASIKEKQNLLQHLEECCEKLRADVNRNRMHKKMQKRLREVNDPQVHRLADRLTCEECRVSFLDYHVLASHRFVAKSHEEGAPDITIVWWLNGDNEGQGHTKFTVNGVKVKDTDTAEILGLPGIHMEIVQRWFATWLIPRDTIYCD
eukprot:c16828_g1_i1.p1 GENE.c16828_g1_i1~~c16828_g1_i1.p1  ORF type:complete len:180 (-),score=44.02 c16828_g1_i1:33-572(-)